MSTTRNSELNDNLSGKINTYAFCQAQEWSFRNIPKLLMVTLQLIVMTIPNGFSLISLIVLRLANVHYVTQKTLNDVNAFGIGWTSVCALVLATIICMDIGLFVQSAQAFGAKNYALCGSYLEKAQAIMALYMAFITVIFTRLDWFLIKVGIPMDIAVQARLFALKCIPYMIMLSLEDSTLNFLTSQKIFVLPNLIKMSIGLCYPLLLHIISKIIADPLTVIPLTGFICEGLTYLALYIVIVYFNVGKDCWTPYSQTAFRDWWPYLKASIPIGGTVFCSWILYEVQTLLIGAKNDEKQLAAHVSFQSTTMIYFFCAQGLSNSVDSYLGNLIGAQNQKAAKSFVKITLLACITLFLLVHTISEAAYNKLLYFCIKDPQLAPIFGEMFYIYINFYMPGDYFATILAGMLRCMGLQNFSIWINITACYLIGLPLMCFFLFWIEKGAPGTWIGLAIATQFSAAVFLIRLFLVDWNVVMTKISDKLEKEQKDLERQRNYELRSLSE